MYHYVRDLKNSRYPEIKGLDINLFKEQIHYMRRNYNFVTMEDVIHSVESGSAIPKKSILLTFDDAYLDHYTNVFPILDKYNIQGSFYVPSKSIQEHTVLDVNKIHFILASVKDKSILVNEVKGLIKNYQKEYSLQDFDHYYKKLTQEYIGHDTKNVIFIKRLLQVELAEDLRLKIVNILFEKYIGVDEDAFSRELYMNEEQLKHMLRSGMHIGNHGYNHYWWNSLSKNEMNNELDLSIKFLENLGIDMNNWTACYPYGSYDDQCIKMLNERGCKLAVTTEVGIATTDKKNRLVMPRLDTNHIPKERLSTNNKWLEIASDK
jgi:peptidoglycan/xylan/chitin deacetylase (PgdA/CDA1 family)